MLLMEQNGLKRHRRIVNQTRNYNNRNRIIIIKINNFKNSHKEHNHIIIRNNLNKNRKMYSTIIMERIINYNLNKNHKVYNIIIMVTIIIKHNLYHNLKVYNRTTMLIIVNRIMDNFKDNRQVHNITIIINHKMKMM